MFQGFSQNAIDFLWGISLNNERGWFMAHKQDFTDYVDIPMRELGKEAFSALAEEYPKQDWRLHVCRIYRDARRLHGRGPYKEHLWFTIERPHERFESVPALYFELAPNYYSYGCGYWDAGAATMAKLRARIDNDPKPLERLARRLNKSKFIVLPLEKPCNIRRFRLSNPQTVCTFPCFFPYGLKQGKDFYSPLTTLSSSRAELRFASLVEWA